MTRSAGRARPLDDLPPAAPPGLRDDRQRRPRPSVFYAGMSWKATAIAFLLLAGCKSDCEKMLDHVAHVSWQHNLATMTPEQKQQTQGLLPSEAQMMPSLREIARKRMTGRCGEPAFVASEAVRQCCRPAFGSHVQRGLPRSYCQDGESTACIGQPVCQPL